MFYSAGKLTLCSSDFQKIQNLLKSVTSDSAKALEQKLVGAKVVADSVLPASVVALDSLVSLREVSTKATIQVQVVEPDKVDADELRISVLSPMGVALIGLGLGTTVEWQVSDQLKRTLTIIAIE